MSCIHRCGWIVFDFVIIRKLSPLLRDTDPQIFSTMATTTNTSDGSSGAAAQPVDNTGNFVNDLINGKTILSQFTNAVAKGDPKAVNEVQANSGYHVTSAGVAKALAAADPGPNFDIRAGM